MSECGCRVKPVYQQGAQIGPYHLSDAVVHCPRHSEAHMLQLIDEKQWWIFEHGKLTEKYRQLEAALRTYGQHYESCDYYHNPSEKIRASLPIVCSCGLATHLREGDG